MNDKSNSHEGIFIVEGGQLTLANLSISVDSEGNITASQPEITLRFDVCPEWLEIAYSHLETNRLASEKIQECLVKKNDTGIGEALKTEFRFGMQSIVASCTAIESLYELVKDKSNIPQATLLAWRKKRTAKYARISETLKVAFGISNDSTQKLREFLKESFSYRDRAIHPNQQFLNPAVHPELNRAVDFKFVLFRHHNAKAIYQFTLSFIYQLCTLKNIKNEAIKSYSEQLNKNLEPMVEKWKVEYGEL